MNQLVNIVGANIRELRKQKKMTQEDLAEKCGLQTSYLAGVERGERNITLQTVEKIASGLNVNAKKLFKIDNPMKYLSMEYEEKINTFAKLLKNKSEKEINLVLKISNEIFDAFK
ncbi:anaerobic benzoate catabolism transcriptional regulator [Solibacillus isronensis B3W22]|uniref:Anaerobic benzoate catabolism transcriptional regulator n=1 Tax=Solibacillus isronensis B3W22 TaxID=1224748 RepID=K1KZT6_9BACL|nr:helix-turn-helix domain-containing protein [Solibacillus isronensis]AMO87254.1 transcriptional regulator [Solibacillus silvestris]EKB45347.1 anaerobic benzoate catabolism transcriptional regulator [Solibacillus isronensis B3W22]